MAGKGVRVPTVLVVDDEKEIAACCSRTWSGMVSLIVAADGEAALRAWRPPRLTSSSWT